MPPKKKGAEPPAAPPTISYPASASGSAPDSARMSVAVELRSRDPSTDFRGPIQIQIPIPIPVAGGGVREADSGRGRRAGREKLIASGSGIGSGSRTGRIYSRRAQRPRMGSP